MRVGAYIDRICVLCFDSLNSLASGHLHALLEAFLHSISVRYKEAFDVHLLTTGYDQHGDCSNNSMPYHL